MSLWDEIGEQPDAIGGILSRNRTAARELSNWAGGASFTHVVIAARGTSDNAARYAQYVWGARNGLTVALAAPSLFGVYGAPPRLEGALVVGISQSGQSPDLVEVLEEARRQSRPTLAITNDGSSPLAAAADHLLELGVGPERAIAATKTYTAQLAAIALISVSMTGEDPSAAGLDMIPSAVAEMLGRSEEIASKAVSRVEMEQCVLLARGFNHATVFEWSLKLQELAYVLAHPYSTADFLHGPVALVEPGLHVLAVAASGSAHAEAFGLLTELVERGSDLMVVSDEATTLRLGAGVALPSGLPEWLTPFPAIVAGQLFTHHLAVAKGLDPDQPRGLQKVTRTR